MKSRLESLLQQFRVGTIYDNVYLPAAAELRHSLTSDQAPVPAGQQARCAQG